MEAIESHGSDRVVGRAAVPSSEDTVTLPPTQGPYRSMCRDAKRRNQQGRSFGPIAGGTLRGAVGL